MLLFIYLVCFVFTIQLITIYGAPISFDFPIGEHEFEGKIKK